MPSRDVAIEAHFLRALAAWADAMRLAVIVDILLRGETRPFSAALAAARAVELAATRN